MNINVKPVITAFDATVKAHGSFKAKVLELYSGCKAASDYLARRKAVNESVDKELSDKDKASKVKAAINSVLNRDILADANIKLVARKGGRKATKATKAAPAATKAATKAAPTAATIQAATTADFLPVVAAWVAGKSKAELTSARQRVDGIFASAIANAK